jgi:hypothetical protein
MSFVEIELAWGNAYSLELSETISAYSMTPIEFRDIDLENCASYNRAEKEKAIEDGRTMEAVYNARTIIAHIDLIQHLVGVDFKILRRVVNKSTEAAMSPLAIREGMAPHFNERCNVSIPASNAGLMSVNRVDVAYDVCTDQLRRHLEEGWSIIAVCVQPDQRRPDYVLGRTGGPERL